MTDDSAALDVLEKPLHDILGEKYLAYALSTIVSRSLPDVRDGLKPVHRRILYAMRQLKLAAASSPKKSARVVGDVIGKFHPHGDQAVYDALVRLAQDFAQRWPLIDGQGNFGTVDGDNAAQMRYTEARMTTVAEALMEGIDEDTVDFRATYDGDSIEPVVLPANFPNLLANGASGIAVGMATSIPPHNLGEICAALLHLIENPDCTVADLLGFIKGPDFPTGGVLVEDADTIRNAYETGRGGLRVRAKWEVETLPQGKWQVVVTALPYQVQTNQLEAAIAEMIVQKKVPLLEDVRNESAADTRLVLTPRSRNVDADMMMQALFKYTALESRFSLNMNVLDHGTVPRVMSLKEVLQAWLDHRHEVLKRRTRHRLDKIAHRMEVLEGYLTAYLNLDEVIRIIRFEDKPKETLMQRFELSDTQADAILNMRLRALHKLEEIEIRREHEALMKEQEDLTGLLASRRRRMTALAREIRDLDKRFGADTPEGARRTEIASAAPEIDISLEAMVEKEPITILCSEKGWIRSMKGHIRDVSETRYKEGDKERFVLYGDTHDKILIFTTDGRFYTLAADKLPTGRGFGEPVRLSVDMESDVDIVSMMIYRKGEKRLVASSGGRGFIVSEDDVIAQTRGGKQILNLPAGEEAQLATTITGDHVAVIGHNRKLLIFPLAELPEMTRGKGVILQKYRSDPLLGNPGLADACVFTLAEGLSWPQGSQTRTETDLSAWLGKRAQAGRLPPHGFPRNNRFGTLASTLDEGEKS